jgi:TP901 family phage tail tape measure protein
MATKIGSLFGDVSLRTAQLDKDIASVGKKLKKMGTGMKSLGKDLTGKLTAPLVGIGVAALVSFGSFEKGMKEVKSLMPDLNQGEFVELQQDVRDLSVEMGVNAVDSVQALYQAISAGVPKDNAISFLETATKTGIAGLSSTTTAVDTLTSILNAYKRPAEDAEDVADALFTTVRLGKTTFDELGASIFNVAPLAAAMNIPLEEVTAAVATLTKQGVPTAQAMTQIRGALVALQKPNADMVTALGNLGYSTGQALLDAKGLQGGLETLRSESGLTSSELTAAFGRVEAFGAVLALTGQNFQGAIEDLRAMTEASGAMTQAFEENNEGLFRSWEKSLAIIREVGFQIAEQLAPHVKEIAETFKDWYAANRESIPGWIELGVKIGALAAVIGPLLMALGSLVGIVASSVTWVLSLSAGVAYLANKTGILKEAGELLGEVIVRVFERDWVGAVKAAIAMMWEIQTTFNPLAMAADYLWSKWRPFWDFFIKQAREAWRMLEQVWGVIKKIAGAPGALGEAVGGLIGDVMYRAEGGPVSSGSPYVVGERGPELLVPRYSRTIVPNHELGGSGQTINMTFNGVGMEMKAWLKNNQQKIARIAVEAVSENRLRTV